MEGLRNRLNTAVSMAIFIELDNLAYPGYINPFGFTMI
jgi:hypothetical protein